mgnify:FL=1
MGVVARPPAHAPSPLMLWAPRLLVAVTVAALVLVQIDAGGPVRTVTTTLALLVAPGLAASLAMGAMSIEARALVSIAGSAALLTVVSMVMALLGWWSPSAGLWICSVVALVLVLVPFLRRPASRSGRPVGHVDHAGPVEPVEHGVAGGPAPNETTTDDDGRRGRRRRPR